MTRHLRFFHSPKCSFCEEALPIVKKIDENGYSVEIINTLENSQLADSYNIERLPTYIFYENGQEKERWIGKTDATTLIYKFEGR